MSIAIQRIERAIADMSKGGMQTGKQAIRLEYSDAQRAIAEIANLQRRNDELVAQVEALRQIFPLKVLIGCDAHLNYPISQYNDVVEAFNKTPAQHLAKIKAEAVQEFAENLQGIAYMKYELLVKSDEYAAKIAGGE